ncbi:MAG: peptidylprolyl isomerase [bacterium]
MIRFMRKQIKSVVFKGILILIVLAFIGTIFLVWGMGSGDVRHKEPSIATIYKENISYREFAESYKQLINLYQNFYKDKFNEDIVKQLNLKQMALDRLIDDKLKLHKAKELKLKALDKEVGKKIKEMPVFNQDGKFDQGHYRNVLGSNGLSVTEFEERVRQDILLKKVGDILMEGIKVSEAEIKDYYREENETVAIDYAMFDPKNFEKDISIEQKELDEFFERNKENYKKPEERKIECLFIDPKLFEKGITLSNERIKDYYYDHEDEYTSPKQLKARHILIRINTEDKQTGEEKAKTKALEVLNKVKAGEDFAQLAKTYSEDKGTAVKGGDLGYFSSGRMLPEFEKAAFALETGEVSDLVKTYYGYHIIKVEDIKEEYTKPLSEVEGSIKESLTQEISFKRASEKTEEVYKEVEKNPDIKKYAEENDYKYAVPEFFAKDGIIEGLGYVPQISPEAFKLNVNKLSEPIKTDSGYYLIKLLEVKEAAIPPFAEVADKVRGDLIKEKARGEAKTLAEQIVTKVTTKGKELGGLLKGQKLSLSTTELFSKKDGYIKGIGYEKDFNETAFRLKKDELKVLEGMKGYYLIRLNKKVEMDENKFQQEKTKIEEQLRTQKKERQLMAWLKEEKEKAVTINPEFFKE